MVSSLIAHVLLAFGTGPQPALAQTTDEIASLNKQASELYQAGKFAEAAPGARQPLGDRVMRRFGIRLR